MDIITTNKDLCRGSYRCVRDCPVKAVRIKNGKAEVIQEKCIACGTCVIRCAQNAMVLRDDAKTARELLATERVVAILAPEFVAAFHPASPERLEAALEQLGFYSIEETVLGEELVATEYEGMISHADGQPLIRSTCPAIVRLLQRYYPEHVSALVPLVSPMIAQGRLVKAIYNDPVKTAYIGPCIARKAEAREPEVADAIDLVLTFDELKGFLSEQGIDLAESEEPQRDDNRPILFKEASLIDGFPRDLLARHSLLDRQIKVIRGSAPIGQLASALERGETRPKIVDVLYCQGCIDGPGIVGTPLSIFARKNVVGEYFNSRREAASNSIRFADLKPRLPNILATRRFTMRPVAEPLPTPEELAKILAEAEKCSPEDELDCGACGYDSCREKAIAIHRGLAEWEMCYPFQRRLMLRLVEKLRELSVTDGLTGLINYRTFTERLAEELSRYQRYGNSLAVLMLDIDLFKSINDALGHVCGDQVLKGIASVLADSVRESDILARYGGDEFAVILPETDKTQGFAVAEKLRSKVETTPIRVAHDGNEHDLKMTISIGVAAGSGTTTADDIITQADRALYSAKASGRNRTELGKDEGTPGTRPAPQEEG